MKTLRELLDGSRTSAAVWLALVEIARRLKCLDFHTTREEIETLTGVAPNGISRALSHLDDAGWIKRKAGFDLSTGTRAIDVRILNVGMIHVKMDD